MSLWSKLSSLSIYPKLVLTFLIVVSPMYLTSWRMNSQGAAAVEREISDSLVSRTTLYMGMLEFDLDRVIRLLQEYVNDDDLLTLSSSAEVMNEIEKMQAQIRLKNRLDLLKKSSKFVANAIVFLPSMNRILSSNDNIVSEFRQDQFEALSKSTDRFQSPFLVWEDKLYVSVPYPDPAILGGREPMFLLAVEISGIELAAVLRDFTNSGGGAVLAGNRIPWKIGGSRGDTGPVLMQEARADGESPAAGQRAVVRSVTLEKEPYLVVTQSSPRLDMTLMMYVPSRTVTSPLDAYRSWLYVLSVVSVFIILLFSYSIYLMIHQPLKKLVRSFRRIEQGQFNLEMNYSMRDEFGYLYGQFNGMVKRLDVLVHEVYEQQYRARLSELRHLQSQINPHFLYNSYFILYRMAMLHDHDNVIYFTKHLGEYFQYITRDGAEEVPLAAEASHARTYAEIQSVRFAKRIRAEFAELPAEAANLRVPRLILQPIIENAYQHGLEDKSSGGWVRVAFQSLPDRVVITVEDNGEHMSEEKLRDLQALLHHDDRPAESTGLVNVHRRIRIRYGGKGGLALQLGGEKGLKVTITIPREEEAADDPPVNRG